MVGIPKGQSMNKKVYEFLRTIPRGKVATYGQIAVYLGNKNLSRAVGNILHNNPDPSQYPCHRVVNSKGQVAPNFAFIPGNADNPGLEGILIFQLRKLSISGYIHFLQHIVCIRLGRQAIPHEPLHAAPDRA